MNKVALIALGGVAGFGLALSVLPQAHGANEMNAYRQLDLFSDAFERVRANYVRPVQDNELVSAAIQGMVSNLDPHSSYMDAKSYNDMQITTKGQFGGVGIEVTQEDGLIKVISPIDGRAIGTVREADDALVRAAMAAAEAGFPAWAATSGEERAAALERAAEMLESHRGELLALLQDEGGKTLDDALSEVREAIDFLVTHKELSADEAYMLTSIAVDFCITQLVDGTLGVHGMIPKEIFKKK